MKFIHATLGSTKYFTLTNFYKNQCEELLEAKGLLKQIDDFEPGENVYIFDTIRKTTVKLFRYQNIRASIQCKLPKPFCNSKPTVKIGIDVNYCFLWCVLAHKCKIHNHREKISQNT